MKKTANQKKRRGAVRRRTRETDIQVKLNLDGTGKSKIAYPLPFLTHMFTLFAKHGLIDLELSATQAVNFQDLKIDPHHLIEDTGLAIGEALAKALGKKKRIERYGHALIPMDESLAEVKAAVDISGRPHFTFQAKFPREALYVDPAALGSTKKPPTSSPLKYYLDVEMLREFFESLVYKAGISLHIDLIRGKNTHHKVEAIFKGFGVALRRACALNPRQTGVPSTKGKL